MERSVLLHHIKTSCYALLAVVFSGWVADALNEGLTFKVILRVFFPNDIERFSHPLNDMISFLVWLIPLLITIMLLLFASVMTLHHVKKPHLYRITKQKPLLYCPHVVGMPLLEQLPAFLQAYASAKKMTLLIPQALQQQYHAVLANQPDDKAYELHLLKEEGDLQKITVELEQWISKTIKNKHSENSDHLFFDITYASPLHGSAALFCSLDQQIELVQSTAKGTLSSYDLICKVQA